MFANIMKNRRIRALLIFTSLVAGSQGVAAASAEADSVSLAPGEQHVLVFPQRLEKVAISDPEVASVTASGDKEVLVTGKAPGAAVVRVWHKGLKSPVLTRFRVASTLGERTPLAMQVQTDIRVVEVNRSELNTLGVYYSKLFDGGSSSIGIAPPGSSGFLGFGSATSAASGITTEGFNLFSFGASSLSIINALESGGFAYTLAQPTLVSMSGQSATFLSGGEFPIPVSSSDGDIQIEYKEFGVSLALTPTVIDEGQLVLRVAPEVSELDYSSGVSSGGVSVPGLRIRRTETTVSMAPGESFIISGLVSRNTSNSSDRIPGLGNLPVLGAFFRSDRVASEDKELIMVVTPRLVSARKKLPAEVRNFGKAYQHSSTEWLDMMMNTRDGNEPIESGLSW